MLAWHKPSDGTSIGYCWLIDFLVLWVAKHQTHLISVIESHDCHANAGGEEPTSTCSLL